MNLRYCELSGVNRLIGQALQWTNLLVRTSPPLRTCAEGLGVGKTKKKKKPTGHGTCARPHLQVWVMSSV